MGTGELSGKPDKMLWSNLQWPSIPYKVVAILLVTLISLQTPEYALTVWPQVQTSDVMPGYVLITIMLKFFHLIFQIY